MTIKKFPADFLWGAATSAYQIEGSPLANGAGASNWHQFSHTSGTVFANQNGDRACDHYLRFSDDIVLMREIGLNSYRFSSSWSRVLPEGTGKSNPRGLEFYNRLVDALVENQIEPVVTLYHWDLPQALEDRGGWAHPDSPKWFAEYADLMYRTLGDRVRFWITINEPWVIVNEGYVEGRHAPGRRDWVEAAAVAKHLLKAHAAAVACYRAYGRNSIGIAVNLIPIHAASDRAADRDAAKRADAYLNRQFLDPIMLGKVPSELRQMFGSAWPEWKDEDLRQINAPVDFIGVNYYLRWLVCDDPSGGPSRARPVTPPGCVLTATEWEIYPAGLREILEWVSQRYDGIPIYITENGAAFDDRLLPNNAINDHQRVQYLSDHLNAARQAIDAGIDLCGYFVWSLLDNFEWQSGYSKRFGIIYVDFETQRRTPKASAQFYSKVIHSNGAALSD